MRYTQKSLAAALAPAVGEERAQELVAEAMRALGIHSHEVTAYEARALLDHLTRHGGVVGACARMASARLPRLRETDAQRNQERKTLAVADVAALLAPSVGQERASELVESVCRKRGISDRDLGREDVEAVLEELAKTPGVVGAVARFAKARALLRFG